MCYDNNTDPHARGRAFAIGCADPPPTVKPRTIALMLAARKVSTRKIAERLGVAQNTVNSWVSDFTTAGEIAHHEPLPTKEALDAIAAEIREQAVREATRKIEAGWRRERGSRHRTGRIARLAARSGNTPMRRSW
jgi:transposase